MRILALASLLVIGAAANAANLIVNGTFEDPAISGWSPYDTIPGWSASVDKIEIGQGLSTYGVTGATGQVLELDANNNAKVDQVLSLSAMAYTLKFDAARRLNGMSGRAADTADFDVLWNGNVVLSVTPASTTMAPYSLNLMGVAGSNTLSFRGMGTNDSYGALIDNVELEAVPEPASMTALALGALAALRRRKSK